MYKVFPTLTKYFDQARNVFLPISNYLVIMESKSSTKYYFAKVCKVGNTASNNLVHHRGCKILIRCMLLQVCTTGTWCWCEECHTLSCLHRCNRFCVLPHLQWYIFHNLLLTLIIFSIYLESAILLSIFPSPLSYIIPFASKTEIEWRGYTTISRWIVI